MCREEALALSSLSMELNSLNVKLHAVVHEKLGADAFKEFFAGDVYLDTERTFYGPHERWMSLALLLRVGVISNIYRNTKKNIKGNMEGEGRLLGGVFVIGPGDQGILFHHEEKEFGDHADINQVLQAAKRVKKLN
ncbi:hypothetical protein ScPMuIL_004965 [Solemya velum]